jgi:hypothetical protein
MFLSCCSLLFIVFYFLFISQSSFSLMLQLWYGQWMPYFIVLLRFKAHNPWNRCYIFVHKFQNVNSCISFMYCFTTCFGCLWPSSGKIFTLSTLLLFSPTLVNIFNCGRTYVLFVNVNVNIWNYMQNMLKYWNTKLLKCFFVVMLINNVYFWTTSEVSSLQC